jgi:hypothetical protein
VLSILALGSGHQGSIFKPSAGGVPLAPAPVQQQPQPPSGPQVPQSK